MPGHKPILAALRKSGDAVTAKMNTLTSGEPEDQLRGPFGVFMQEVGHALVLKIVCTSETLPAGRLGKPDYAVHAPKLLAGHVELRKPGLGANLDCQEAGFALRDMERRGEIEIVRFPDYYGWGLIRLRPQAPAGERAHLSANVAQA
ncbi:MAG TPA: hypothetical protein VM695_11920 [Phycisphaerae bacterium]|nr:hypothetical protein [Phycisphaerae bacterium]